MLCIIPTLMVLSFFFQFFFNSRILQTGILKTGPNHFVENQKQNQDNTRRFGMKNLPKRLGRNVLAETSCSQWMTNVRKFLTLNWFTSRSQHLRCAYVPLW